MYTRGASYNSRSATEGKRATVVTTLIKIYCRHFYIFKLQHFVNHTPKCAVLYNVIIACRKTLSSRSANTGHIQPVSFVTECSIGRLWSQQQGHFNQHYSAKSMQYVKSCGLISSIRECKSAGYRLRSCGHLIEICSPSWQLRGNFAFA